MGTKLKVPICTPAREGPPLNLPYLWTALWVPKELGGQSPTDLLGRSLPESCVWATAAIEGGSYFYTTEAETPPFP